MIARVNGEQSQLAEALRRDPASFLYSLAKTHRGEDVALPNVFGSICVVQNPETAAWVLSNKEKSFDKYYGYHKTLLGRSRLTSDGADWRDLRDLSQNNILAPSDAEVERVAQAEFGLMLDQLLESGSNGVAVPIDEAIDVAALRVLSTLIFKIPPDLLSSSTVQSLRAIFRLTTAATWTPKDQMPTLNSRIMLDAQAGFKHLQAQFLALEERSETFPKDNLLTRLLSSDQPRLDAMSEFATLLVAGYETTASAISWILFSLARSQSLQDAARNEIRSCTEDPDFQMSLVSRIVSEALRLFPPVPAVGRISNRSVVNGDLHLERGQRVLVSLVGVNIAKHHAAQPFSFAPDRFLRERSKDRPNTSTLTFGYGQRVCPGSKFAISEIETAIRTLLHRAKFAIDPVGIGQLEWGISMRRHGGTKLKVSSI